MKYYFKYTDGNAFTLDGVDYKGFFNFQGNTAYTQRDFNIDSQPLTFKNTYISDFYKNKLEFDVNYGNLNIIRPFYSNSFDIFDAQGIKSLTDTINYNNLLCFKGFNISNPIIYNFEKNNNFFYGLSNINAPILGFQQRRHIEPFTSNKDWEFLDKVTSGCLFVNSEDDFKYYCTTGDVDYILKGSFIPNSKLEIIYKKDLHPDYTTDPDYNYHIHHDLENLKLYVVNNDFIRVYDTTKFDECENLPLIDQIPLNKTTTNDHIFGKTNYKFGEFHYKFMSRFHTFNDNNPYFIKFGKNVRTSYSNSNLLVTVNKYSNTRYQYFDLNKQGVVEVIDINISPITDDIIVLHKKDDKLYLLVIYGLNANEIFNYELKSYKESSWYKVSFSNVDSNLIYFQGENEFQSRHLTDPEYPSGRLEQGELLYFKRYTFSKAIFKFSNNEIKFNSAKYKSNSFNNLVGSETIKNDNMYMLLHNVGRLYALKQPIKDFIYSIVPSNLTKYFNGIQCSESSLGLYLNSILSNLIKDTLNLLVNAEGKFKFDENTSMIISLQEVQVSLDQLKNFQMNGNETVNVITLQRILGIISNIQHKLFPE